MVTFEDYKILKGNAQNLDSEGLLHYVLDKFDKKVALASSFSAEDQVITDMLCKITKTPAIFTLDTGRLPQETYDVIEETRKEYNVKIQMMFPNYKQVEKMVTEHGPNLFYNSVENRKLCCRIRKVEPLKRALDGLDGWICGLRIEQSATRQELEKIEWDDGFELIKINPLADWTTEQVWQYIKNNNVPYNKLHDEGYPSIGCAPCSRAVKKGQDIRSGRWWWEQPEHKECGLHLKRKSK